MTNVIYNTNSPFAIIPGEPFVTISPIGFSTTNVVNNGADFGPDTPGTYSSGLVEFMNTLPTSTSSDLTNMYSGYILPGALLCTQPVSVPAQFLHLLGSGKRASSIKASGSISTAGSFISWPSTYTPRYSALGNGTYIGHLGFDGGNKAFAYLVTFGIPAVLNTPYTYTDIAAPGFLMEHLVGQGDNTAGGIVYSSLEDGLLVQPDMGSSYVEWNLNNGSAKLIGRNLTTFSVMSSNFSIIDTVMVNLYIGNIHSPSLIDIRGCGFNGFPSASAPQSNNTMIQVYPYNYSGLTYPTNLSTQGIDWALSGGASAGSGYIGGPGASQTIVTSNGDKFSLTSNNAFFATGVVGFGKIINGLVINNGIVNFLGTGSFLTGNAIDNTNVNFNFNNGFLTPLGLISSPFGTYLPWNSGGPWNSTTAYVIGNQVISSGVSYTCILGNTNQAPPNGTYWSVNPSINAIGPGLYSTSSAPIANTSYTTENDTLLVLSSGGQGINISVTDTLSNIIYSGLSALPYPGAVLYPGMTINFGSFKNAPTVSVFGA